MFGKVLIIAIDNYRTVPLRGCLLDAEDVFETFKHVGYDPRRIRYLANDRATRANIVAGLKWLSDSDYAFCYYAGHGGIDIITKHPSLLCYDYDTNPQGGLGDAEIEQCLGNMNGMIFYDCCYSGSLCSSTTDGSRFALAVPECVERFIPSPGLPEDTLVDLSQRGSGTLRTIDNDLHLTNSRFVYLSASRDSEPSNEVVIDNKPRGIFTYNLCKQIRDKHDCGIRELWSGLTDGIQETLSRMIVPRQQHPQLWCREDLLDKPLLGAWK